MTEPAPGRLAHLLVENRAQDLDFTRRGGGPARVREVDRQAHGQKLKDDLERSFDSADEDRVDSTLSLEELRASGTIVVIESYSNSFPLNLDQLESLTKHRARRPRWLLLSVSPGSDTRPEQAVIWISDEFRAQFMKLLDDFLEKNTPKGKPKNAPLVANMAAIRHAVIEDLWRSEIDPPRSGLHWWELWLRPEPGAAQRLRDYASSMQLQLSNRQLLLVDRLVMWIRSSWSGLQPLPFTAVPVAEIRAPQFVDTFEDLQRDEQDEFTEDLAERIVGAPQDSPVVCHLDTGVRRSHALLRDSLADSALFTVVADGPEDRNGHGTRMAGLGLLGDLYQVLSTSSSVQLTHRLESVKILPDRNGASDDPLAYGFVTAQAVALPEIAESVRRIFCMPVTTQTEAVMGQPSLWSASVDALAAGVDIARSGDEIELIGLPEPDASRLFVISAGNVPQSEYQEDYVTRCELSGIADPAQAWNALTVGAYTDLDATSDDPAFHGWRPLASKGDISPHSRTSVGFSTNRWPIKPEICLEGGNVLTNGQDFHGAHPALCVRTTENRDDLAIGSANATSAATAQAANLAGRLAAAYPDYWPETLRGVLVHSAEWTPYMRATVDGVTGKREKLSLLRRYGWGVPSTDAVLSSTRTAVTLVTQDEFKPFEGKDHKVRHFRLHSLPWPTEALREIGAGRVRLKATLSYFVEPTGSRRGWRRRYSYASHGLRFDLKSALESRRDFVARINRQAEDEEEAGRPSGAVDRWMLGPNQRNQGSLHQDIWEGTGSELAPCDSLAVYAIGGWWKNNGRSDRADLPVRYSLTISLRTPVAGIDLYTPIANTLSAPVQVLASDL